MVFSGVLDKTAKIIGEKYGVRVIFSGDQPCTNGNTIILPALPTKIDDFIADIFRGYCDHEVGHVRYTNMDVWNSVVDNKRLVKMLNIIEDIRVEREMVKDFIGTKHNISVAIQYLFDKDCFPLSNAVYRLSIEGRKRLYGCELNTEDVSEQVKADFGNDIFERLEAMQNTMDALDIAKSILEACEGMEEGMGKGVGNPDSKAEIIGGKAGSMEVLKDIDESEDVSEKIKTILKERHIEAIENGEYLVYSTEKDLVWTIPQGDLRVYQELRDSLSGLNVFRQKIVTFFKARIASRWHSGCEEGRLDARMLHRSQFGYTNIFKKKIVHSEEIDTAVTFLVDFSGSMGSVSEGHGLWHAMRTAVLFLESFAPTGIKTELLGYTTGEMFSVKRECDAEGKEVYVGRKYGRIEQLVTYVFKTFDEPYNAVVKKRIGYSKNLETDQNCDGDSLLVAYDRLRVRPERRKILFMLTDGAVENYGNIPMGEKFLKDVVKRIEKEGIVDLVGIGFEYNYAGLYFSKVIEINEGKGSELAQTMYEEIRKIFKV